jgi:hypothetical protein
MDVGQLGFGWLAREYDSSAASVLTNAQPPKFPILQELDQAFNQRYCLVFALHQKSMRTSSGSWGIA